MFVTTPFYNLNGVVYYTFDLAIRAKYNGLKQPNEMFLQHKLVQRYEYGFNKRQENS